MLDSIFQRSRKALVKQKRRREELASSGIDIYGVPVGYDTGRFHYELKDDEVESWEETGYLKPSGRGYRSRFAGWIVFPLVDAAGKITDLWGTDELENANGELLSGHGGLFPAHPSPGIQVLFVASSIPEAAHWLACSSESTGIVAVQGSSSTQTLKQVLEDLTGLNQVSLSSAMTEERRVDLQGLVLDVHPHITIQITDGPQSSEAFGIASQGNDPESEVNPGAEETTRCTQKIPGNYTWETRDPQEMAYRTDSIWIDVLGGVSPKVNRLVVTLRMRCPENPLRAFRDTVNLYNHGQLTHVMEEAARMLFLDTRSLEEDVQRLTALLEQWRRQQVSGAGEANAARSAQGSLPLGRMEKAQALLESPDLYTHIRDALGRIGIEGEERTTEILFLAMTSRLLRTPLHVVLHAGTGSGKSILMESVARCMPETSYMEVTSLSKKSFYHFESNHLSHKVLLIQDWFALDSELEYVIRELESKGKISRVITMRDKNHGLLSVLKEVHGPVSIISATTKGEIYADNANRSIQLYLNEERAQDQRIIRRQQMAAAGLINRASEEEATRLLRDLQQILKTYEIVNPYATVLELPPDVPGVRRLYPIYLNLIASITLLHQRQRLMQGGKLVADPEDVKIASELMTEILIPKMDLLPRTTRVFFEKVEVMLRARGQAQFTQREMVRHLRMSPGQVKRHTRALEERGFLDVVGGDRYRGGYEYALVAGSEEAQYRELIEESFARSLEQVEHLADRGSVGHSGSKPKWPTEVHDEQVITSSGSVGHRNKREG